MNITAISACRTPMGAFGGTLKNMAAYDINAIFIVTANNQTRESK